MRYQRIDFVGYRIFNGGSYKIACSVSIVLNSEQTIRQVEDAAKKMFALNLVDLEWRVEKKNYEALLDTVLRGLRKRGILAHEHTQAGSVGASTRSASWRRR